MKSILIHNATIVNENQSYKASLLIKGKQIFKIFKEKIPKAIRKEADIIDAEGKYLIPGVIDDQVHFREPGLTHKANIYTESKAAVAGGITSFMEMPNTKPQTISQPLLEDKFSLAAKKSLANFSFYFGATNDNMKEIIKTDPLLVCGIKVFMGSSTGNMLVDNENSLREIFSKAQLPVAVHCEDEQTIKKNIKIFKHKYGANVPIKMHPQIRSHEACFKSSSLAVKLAKEYGTRLHLLHLSTSDELNLLDNSLPSAEKQITAEVCVHHLWFSDADYEKYGTHIKWNPAIKKKKDRTALRQAVKDNRIDVIATDHAPHTLDEKSNTYFSAPSGGPLVQHSLVALLEMVNKGVFSIEKVVEKMCHTPAQIFKVSKRGFIRENYFADIVLLDMNSPWTVSKENILYKCKWSPFEKQVFNSKVSHTFVNGHLVYKNGLFDESQKGRQLLFDR